MIEKSLRCEPDCRRCGVRDSVLFAGLDEAVLEEIQESIDDLVIPPGQSVYRMGSPGTAAFTLRAGVVKLVQYLPDGAHRIVRLVRPTDVFGLEALIGQRYQHDAIVVQRASLCRLPSAVLMRLDREHPGLHQELMRRWQRALSEADAWLTELSTGSAHQRVVRLLLRLVDERGIGLCPLFSRKDMGAMLGITTESASRAVADLKRKGILTETAQDFRCDPVALRQLAAD
ncbi:MAG: Crp/Fnr family transcriptional regulator [Thiohalomonadaceae bacterium]